MIPTQVKGSFAKKMAASIACHKELLLAIHNKRNEQTLHTMLAEQFVMLGVVAWEGHLNDLFISYIQQQPATALDSIEKRIHQSIVSKFGERAANCVSFEVKKPVTAPQIAKLLDPKSWNITVRSSDELSKKANELLHATDAKKFSLDRSDSEFLDYAIAMRNYLSHRSKGSYDTLKAGIANLSETSNQQFVGSITNLGCYLKSITASGESRAIEVSVRLVDLASRL